MSSTELSNRDATSAAESTPLEPTTPTTGAVAREVGVPVTDLGDGMPGSTGQFIVFQVGAESYGIDITAIREIKAWTGVTPLPGMVMGMRGVMSLRGAMVPVFDLRERLGGGRTEPTANHVVIITSIGGRSVGLLVDVVSDIVMAGPADIQPVPELGASSQTRCLLGLVSRDDRMIALIDSEGLLDASAMQAVAQVTMHATPAADQQAPEPAPTPESLFVRLGGEAAVSAAVDKFYEKVLADTRISGFFETLDMDAQRAKQRAFMTYAFGGATQYTGRSLAAAHKRLVEEQGLDDTHFEAVAEALAGTLQELGVPDDLQAEVLEIVGGTRDAVLGRTT